MPHGDKAIGVKAEDAQEFPKDLTIPKLFHQQAKRYGKDRVAMREKEFGIWRPITWQDYLDNVKYIALGLIKLGLQEGDKVAMIGDNRPEGLMAEMAALCARGVGVWLFQDCLMDEVRYIIDHSDAKFVFGEGQEEVDKVLSILKDCPKLKKIIWDDPKGLRQYDQDCLISLRDVQELGRELPRRRDRPALLHLRHDRAAQGGAALPPQHAVHGQAPDGGGPLQRQRRLRLLSAVCLDRRADDVDLLRPSDGLHVELPRGAGYLSGQHPRDRPACHVRPAPHVRADDPHRPGQVSGCHVAEAHFLPVRDVGRLPRGGPEICQKAGALLLAGPAWAGLRDGAEEAEG